MRPVLCGVALTHCFRYLFGVHPKIRLKQFVKYPCEEKPVFWAISAMVRLGSSGNSRLFMILQEITYIFIGMRAPASGRNSFFLVY